MFAQPLLSCLQITACASDGMRHMRSNLVFIGHHKYCRGRNAHIYHRSEAVLTDYSDVLGVQDLARRGICRCPGLDTPAARAVGEGAATAAQGAAPAYVPGPVEVGWEIYVGAAACVAVFALGAWEFAKRIVSDPQLMHCVAT